METYKYWDILDELPDGWRIDETAGAPAPLTVFITNGKSLISGKQERALLRVKRNPVEDKSLNRPQVGQERALLRVKRNPVEDKSLNRPQVRDVTKNISNDKYEFPAKSVNELARLKFKESILKEILFDLTVCELEGWSKTDYINELKDLINKV